MKKRRKYEMQARAETQAETRQRITVAAVELHQELGPAQTSISAVAERAGVQRLTVYRHFPDELSLLRACGGHYRALHPPPELSAWRQLKEGPPRVMVALFSLYRHFRETRGMWSHVLRDAGLSPVVREAAEPRFRYLAEAAQILGEGWSGLGPAAIAHAVQFHTWESLARLDLGDEQAAELMTALAKAARSL
jgi:AcrR family transcriptional regulator